MPKLATLLLLLALAPLSMAQVDAPDDDPWGEDAWDDWEDEGSAAAPWTGFVEAGAGGRLRDDPALDGNVTLEEFRWRIEREWQPGRFTLSLRGDLGYDGVTSEFIADVRELAVAFRAGDKTDIKAGRQVQTWGVGDLLFLNDLFPKDYPSFFSGRDDEYLKAPSNAVRVTHYADIVNVDFVWTPVFEPDAYLTGERFSFFSPLAGGNVAPDPPLDAIEPDKDFGNGEFAVRLFRSVGGTEYAAYLYRGYFKQPTALTASFEPTFAPLSAYGASLRRPVGPGLLSAEFAWYDSRDDGDGTDPLVPNSQIRFLAGYEWEAIPNLTVGLQYYVERIADHENLVENSPFPSLEPDEIRHLLTNRLTWRLSRDRYTLSLFTFWSPSDEDFYLRPSFRFRRDDHWEFVAGGNLFGGDAPQTFFSQLQDGSNVYLRIRYNY